MVKSRPVRRERRAGVVSKLLPRNKKSPDPAVEVTRSCTPASPRKRCRPSKYEGLFLSAELLRAWAIIKHYSVRGRGPKWREKRAQRWAVTRGTFGACLVMSRTGIENCQLTNTTRQT